jgi:hypothetical protein
LFKFLNRLQHVVDSVAYHFAAQFNFWK